MDDTNPTSHSALKPAGSTLPDVDDDPATMAASEELKHTSISDKLPPKPPASYHEDASDDDKPMGSDAKALTPPAETTDTHDEEMRERMSSPKKKRGRDQEDDEDKESEDDKTELAGATSDGSGTERLEPLKKKHRDTTNGSAAASKSEIGADEKTAPTSSDGSSTEPTASTESNDKKTTSAAAFSKSGFGALSGSNTSGFGALAASKPSVFGGDTNVSSFASFTGGNADSKTSAAPKLSSFASPSDSGKENVKLGFGSTFGSSSASGFGGLASGSVFGGGLKNGFAGGSATKLSSFAAPAEKADVALGAKSAKPFGAPESDEEESASEDEDDDGEDSSDEDPAKTTEEEKKKVKLTSKVPHEDGEEHEETLLQLRAKLFSLSKDTREEGWKERGSGIIRVKALKECVSYDYNGRVEAGSFDISSLDDTNEDEDAPPKVAARLIMRQENTGRVILNIPIDPFMHFDDKPSNNAVKIVFIAHEVSSDGKTAPSTMTLRMNENNAALFMTEVASIQRELQM